MGATYSVPHKETKFLNEFMDTMPSMEGKIVAITGTTSGTLSTASSRVGTAPSDSLAAEAPCNRRQPHNQQDSSEAAVSASSVRLLELHVFQEEAQAVNLPGEGFDLDSSKVADNTPGC